MLLFLTFYFLDPLFLLSFLTLLVLLWAGFTFVIFSIENHAH